MNIVKRNGNVEPFDFEKIRRAITAAFVSNGYKEVDEELLSNIDLAITQKFSEKDPTVEEVQDLVEEFLMDMAPYAVVKSYIVYRGHRATIRDYVSKKKSFIESYKRTSNTANATIDDNSNVGNKNIGVLNAEIHKSDNVEISRGMIMDKLRELYPDFDAKNYIKDLESHIIYKHDESSFAGAIAPYCTSITMYPFLLNGIKELGGLSASPKNIDSFCGMFCNLIFAVAGQFAGAVATSEFFLYFTYFAKKEWGDDFFMHPDKVISTGCSREKTIRSQIHQYFQAVTYTINQPAANRGMQSAFWNVSYFDKPFFEGMFGDFCFPDGSRPDWDSLKWVQKEFMQWFNEERLRTMLTFPVESATLLYKDNDFVDKEMYEFICDEYARGHSFFTYISDSVDSLSSCCRLKNKLQTREFNFTNGNIGVQTGSKSVITLNLNRIVQNWAKDKEEDFLDYLDTILARVYKYHIAYNELLWDVYNTGLLPVYKAGFINLNKQYLTIGLNGLNEAAEFMGMKCSDNENYARFCQQIFSRIKDFTNANKGKVNGHEITMNCELVPAESLAVKNYNWDKNDGYWVPEDRNLYASYIFIPSDNDRSVLEKFRMHGSNYIGDYLEGGSAFHCNLDSHLSKSQYKKLIKYAAEVGCQYFTFNVPNCECEDCGFIAKSPFDVCPKCGSTHVVLWDRIIGYLSKVKNWSSARQKEQKTRIYSKSIE